MGKAKILFSQCIVALTILVFFVDHRELTKQMTMMIVVDSNATLKVIPNTSISNKHIKEEEEEENAPQQQQPPQRIRPPFAPNQVLEQYIQWHSESALADTHNNNHNHNNHDNNHDSQRQYALIYYYCPHRAGNILHSMFNSVLWAILHNRTILWKYDTDFSNPNTVDDCQQTLQRAHWWPSWDEWAPQLNLTEPIPMELDPSRIHEYRQHRIVVFPMIPDQMSRHEQFVHSVDWRDDPMHKRQHRQYIMAMDETAIRTAGRLYKYGVDYLLGTYYVIVCEKRERAIFRILV